MGSEKEAMEAAKALNGTKLLGRQVFVSNELSFACFVGVDYFLFRIPINYDNHPIPSIHPIPQSLFDHLNMPRIDLSRPPMN